MGIKMTKSQNECISRDIWKEIFFYLNGDDLLNCALVCRYFYQLQCNNYLWFQKVLERKLYLTQKVSIRHPIVCYYPEVDYKQYYLSLFYHTYEFQLFSAYKNLKSEYHYLVVDGSKKDYSKNKFKFICFYVPIQILLFPFYCFVELLDYIYCKKREKNVCHCKKCKWKQQVSLSRIER
jgi:hypothetical protein